MTFDEFKAKRAELESAVDRASDGLRPFPRGPMGITPDEVKATPEWKAARAEFARAFDALRALNGRWVGTFKRELAQERKAARAR